MTAPRLSVGQVARDLGLQVGRRIGPCPACRAERTGRTDRRPPLGLGHGGTSWTCYACRATGDAVDLVSYALLGRRGREAGAEFAHVTAWLADRSHVELEVVHEPEPAPKPAEGVADALRACRRPAEVPEIASYLRSRAIDPELAPGGVLPPSFSASWWPSGWALLWPLVVPTVDHEGHVRSLHGRHVPGYGSRTPDRKSTWPVGLSAQGLVFADPRRARPWLQGGRPPAKVLVVEGITDFLTVAGATLDDLGVLGIESGSASAFARMPWARGQAVYLATDQDEAGRRYAEQIRSALPTLLPVYTVPVRDLHRATAA